MLRSPLRPLLRKPMQGLIGPGPYTLVQKAIGILRSYGADAHIYLPGVGTVNGITAGNYLDSAGVTAASVDNPVGLSLDALQAMTLGANLVPATYAGPVSGSWTISASSVDRNSSASGQATLNLSTTLDIAKLHRIVFAVTGMTGDTFGFRVGGAGTAYQVSANGQYSASLPAGATTASLSFIPWGGSAGTAVITSISVQEIPGIHATQGTTANKGLLRLTSGKYNWVFDATDLLTATYPAGNESVTVIDSFLTGQVTTAGVNVVGAYSMGPSVTLYGRMIIKGSISASDLLVLQRFANSWAGL